MNLVKVSGVCAILSVVVAAVILVAALPSVGFMYSDDLGQILPQVNVAAYLISSWGQVIGTPGTVVAVSYHPFYLVQEPRPVRQARQDGPGLISRSFPAHCYWG